MTDTNSPNKVSVSTKSTLSQKSDSPLVVELAEKDALFMSIGDGAITTDDFGRITRVNSTALQILGFKQSDLIGKPFLKKIIAENLDGQPMTVIDRPIARAFLTGKPVSGIMHYRTKNGNIVPVSINVSPIMHNDRPIGAIEVFRDVSEELEVDRMKSEFISLASHQLRTPLSAIKTYTHMLSDGYMGDLNDTQKKSLETIIGASNRMNELISTLLNITRIESGSISVNLKKYNLNEIIKEVLPELTLMADSKAITLNLKVTGTLSMSLKSDALIIKEIVTNLVSNAIKYTPENGQVNIILKPRRNDFLIEINDTGWGIPELAQEKVFSKFFRGANIIKQETSGTGLGLYLVKGLLEALGGKIWFKSQEDNGTNFYFTLPRNTTRPKKIAKSILSQEKVKN